MFVSAEFLGFVGYRSVREAALAKYKIIDENFEEIRTCDILELSPILTLDMMQCLEVLALVIDIYSVKSLKVAPNLYLAIKYYEEYSNDISAQSTWNDIIANSQKYIP